MIFINFIVSELLWLAAGDGEGVGGEVVRGGGRARKKKPHFSVKLITRLDT